MKLSDGIKAAVGWKKILQVVGKLCDWTIEETEPHTDELLFTLLFSFGFDLLSGRHSASLEKSNKGQKPPLKCIFIFPVAYRTQRLFFLLLLFFQGQDDGVAIFGDKKWN